MSTLLQDLRFGFRMLAKNPGFTAMAVITLALGIGANTAIFSVVDAVIVRPLPYVDSDRIVFLRETNSRGGWYPLSGPDYLDWRAQTQTMADTTVYGQFKGANLNGAGEPEKVEVDPVAANFFSMLGAKPALGRTFMEGEDQPGRNHVAVLTYPFWQGHFAGAKDVLGKEITLDGERYTIIGVSSASIPAPSGWLDMYLGMDMSPAGVGDRGERKFEVLGRLKPGISLAQGRAEFQTIMSRLAQQYPESNKDVGGLMFSLHELVAGHPEVEMYTLLTIVGMVLLIACANVANLSLVRASGRQQEMAVRNALGAGRSRLVRQLLTESVLLAMAGTAVAWPLGWAGMRLLTMNRAMEFPVVNVIDMNTHVLAFTLGVGLLVGILVGLAPALRASSLNVNEELKSSAQAVVSSPRGWRLVRDALVVGEIAIALVLLVGTGLLLRSFAKMQAVELGIQPESILTVHISLPPYKYSNVAQKRAFFDQLVQNLQREKGVKEVATSFALPLEGGMFDPVSVAGQQVTDPDRSWVAGNAVTPDYFRMLGISFLRGRNFTPQEIDSIAESVGRAPGKPVQLVAIINQKMALQYWPGQDPLGRIFTVGRDQATVVGVVANTTVWPGSPPFPQTYYPFPMAFRSSQSREGSTQSILLKGTADNANLGPVLRQQIRALDDSLALYQMRTMREVVADANTWSNSASALLTTFALLALVLTAVGIYGVMSYAVTERTHEIGLRLALGASSRGIIRLVMRQGARIIIIGVVLGVAGALALSRVMANFVFGVKPRDPVTFVFVTAFVAVIALLASYIPARRAAKVDPMVALRYE